MKTMDGTHLALSVIANYGWRNLLNWFRTGTEICGIIDGDVREVEEI